MGALMFVPMTWTADCVSAALSVWPSGFNSRLVSASSSVMPVGVILNDVLPTCKVIPVGVISIIDPTPGGPSDKVIFWGSILIRGPILGTPTHSLMVPCMPATMSIWPSAGLDWVMQRTDG